jgi:hypothetical protein
VLKIHVPFCHTLYECGDGERWEWVEVHIDSDEGKWFLPLGWPIDPLYEWVESDWLHQVAAYMAKWWPDLTYFDPEEN